MSINTEKAKMTLDFIYNFEGEEGTEGFSMPVKYFVSEEYGLTIAISEDGKEYKMYPAEMFYDIVDFIKEKSLLGEKIENKDTENKVLVGPFSSSSSSLPLPSIQGSAYNPNVAPIQSFESQSEDNPVLDNKVPPGTAEGYIVQLEEEVVEEEEIVVVEMSEEEKSEEAKKQWAEREAAAKKAENNKKSIKRKES